MSGMNKHSFFKATVSSVLFICFFAPIHGYPQSGAGKRAAATLSDRDYWLQQLDKMARPVLSNLAKDNLKKAMPMVLSKRSDNPAARSKVGYLEALGRLISGIGPWLNLEGGAAKEAALRAQYRQWAL